MNISFAVLILVAYAIVETLEKFGVKRKYAHLAAIPIGLALSFLVLNGITLAGHILYGILIGLGAVGSCDTLCNIVDTLQKDKSN